MRRKLPAAKSAAAAPFLRPPLRSISCKVTRMSHCRAWSRSLVTSFTLNGRSLGAARARLHTSLPAPCSSPKWSSRSYSSNQNDAAASSGARSRILGASLGLAAILGGIYWLGGPERDRLSPYKFSPLKIISIATLTPETSLFKLALPKEMLDPKEIGSSNSIRSLYVMQPDLQIQRPYTVSYHVCQSWSHDN